MFVFSYTPTYNGLNKPSSSTNGCVPRNIEESTMLTWMQVQRPPKLCNNILDLIMHTPSNVYTVEHRGEKRRRRQKRLVLGNGYGHGEVEVSNRFKELEDCDDDEEVAIGAVEDKTWTRMSGMTFNVADVKKSLAAAAKVVEAGNRVVLGPDPEKSYVENIKTKEKMRLRKEKGVCVIDVKYEDGKEGVITLDSGAGVSVWPRGMRKEVKMMPRKEGLRMVAANGTEIENFGQKIIKFQGMECGGEGFSWRS
jgi:hypothetical protein